MERAKARAPEATFVTSLSPTVVQADPVLLERAVLNLLDNAVKYSPAGAPIEVTVRDGEVVVADHGPGVAEEDLPRGSSTGSTAPRLPARSPEPASGSRSYARPREPTAAMRRSRAPRAARSSG